MIKAVIFDMDGVLIDSEVEYSKRFKKLFDEANLAYTNADINALIGSNASKTDEILEHLGNGIYKSADLWRIWHQHLQENPIDYRAIRVDHVVDVLHYLKEHGYKIGLASATEKENIIKEMEACKILSYFDAITSGHECKESKPAPDVYLKTMNALQVKPEEVIVVEDSFYGIQAATDAKVHMVLARRVKEFTIDQSKADHLINDLKEVIYFLEGDQRA